MKTAIYVAVLLVAMGAIWFQFRFRQQPLPKYAAVPSFRLTERSGKTLSSDDLKGKVWLADFIYTTCPGPCPMLSSRFSKLQETGLKAEDVRFVSISINPEHDTPEVLRNYAEHFQAGEKWLFLTGEKEQVRDLVIRGFMQTVVEQKSETMPLIHSTKLVLVDRQGSIRGFYDGVGEHDDAQIVGDIERLRRE